MCQTLVCWCVAVTAQWDGCWIPWVRSQVTHSHSILYHRHHHYRHVNGNIIDVDDVYDHDDYEDDENIIIVIVLI